ncbi:hypothetical protein [Rhizobium sp. CC-YZS058]|uniref:hypothetical protein n=1 Tax=Rhizobium sp. CC-YZS058 TaxID=3042153 RepID=UPI002B05705D|nr:hypothetical protein [Rhizobium sp. CC-YZS058]MEA3535172.1 hypothetical protein [Rhizobium sp. CC-YZS058]
MARWTTLAVSALLLLSAPPLHAQQSVLPENVLPENVTFVTSTGFWEESADAAAQSGDAKPASAGRRGYYKLIALRQPEGNAHIVLQQIALEAEGPKVVTSAELEEFSRMKAFVTDIRPESSDGVTSQPGLFATVYLRTDPSEAEPQGWTVLIDDIGDIRIERASN